MTLPKSVGLLIASFVSAGAGDSKSPVAAAGDWEFSLSAGPAWRSSGPLKFNGGSYSAGTPIPSWVGGNVLLTPPIGPADQIADRFYNDGFVRRDLSTDIDGLTTFWGYQSAGQVAGDDLSFHATGFQSVRSGSQSLGTASSVDRHEEGLAPILQFDASYRHDLAGFRPGLSGSLMWSPIKLDRQWSDFAASQTRDDFRHDWTDHYNLGGFGASIPSAPYAGSPSGPGFALENIPDRRDFSSVWIGSDDAVLSNAVATRFRADQTTISFGPTLARRLNEQWSVEGGIGFALNWLHWSATQTETLSVEQNGSTTEFARWKDSTSGNKLLGGIYLQVGSEWTPMNREWSIKSFLRADFGGTFTQQIGPSEISYDTDGITGGVMFSHVL
ncbi:hypothetical protein HQ447_17250 [bacterium]|nr:hypothetical protein [bacterium]